MKSKKVDLKEIKQKTTKGLKIIFEVLLMFKHFL